MSKNEIPKKLSPKKNKNFTTRVGNFLSDFFSFFSISPSLCSIPSLNTFTYLYI